MTDNETRMLAFEKQWFRRIGEKETAIRETFDWSPVRYYTRLNRLLDDPQALAAEPVLVNRLRRIRDSRLSARAVR